jgi:hypothetical protein
MCPQSVCSLKQASAHLRLWQGWLASSRIPNPTFKVLVTPAYGWGTPHSLNYSNQSPLGSPFLNSLAETSRIFKAHYCPCPFCARALPSTNYGIKGPKSSKSMPCTVKSQIINQTLLEYRLRKHAFQSFSSRCLSPNVGRPQLQPFCNPQPKPHKTLLSQPFSYFQK